MNICISALLGNVFYYYHNALFGWVAPYMAPVLFPDQSPLIALTLTFLFLPLKKIMRPLGGLLWGWLGDYWGRRPTVFICLLSMAFITGAMGLLPQGRSAPYVLTLLCLLHGFFSVGQVKSAPIMALEATSPHYMRWVSALFVATSTAGVVLASLIVGLLGVAYWRVLFFIGAIIGCVAAWLRYRSSEFAAFEKTKGSFKQLWQERWLLLRIICVSGFSYGNYYLVTIFLNGMVPLVTGIASSTILSMNTWLLWGDFLLVFLFACINKKVNAITMMRCGIACLLGGGVILYGFLPGASVYFVLFMRFFFIFFGVMVAVPIHGWKFSQLPVKNRLFIGNAAGAICIGSFIPAIAAYCVSVTGQMGAAMIPLIFVGIAAYFSLK